MAYLGTAERSPSSAPASASAAWRLRPSHGRAWRVRAESLRGLAIWVMAFAGGFVFIEPGPYELVGLTVIALFVLTGLPLRPALMPLLLILIVLNLGYDIAVVQVIDDPKAVMWVYISAFMAVTAIFFAAVVGNNTAVRVDLLLRGYVAAAVAASLVAIVAYFHPFGSITDEFLLYGRARGTFNDPNVLGAFLVLPVLVLFQRILTGKPSEVFRCALPLLAMLLGLFLSFSRGAWGQLVLSVLVLMATGFATSGSTRGRARILLVAIAGGAAAIVLLSLLLSIPQVADLFSERATLDQSYDLGYFGRFSRYALGAELGLEKPLGIGPLQFWHFFGEDPHNSYLNSFMSGGWLSGFAYLTLTAVTLLAATRFLRADTPWRSSYQVLYAGFIGVAAESALIDIEHWRHYYLILGALWGLMAASRAYFVCPGAIARFPKIVGAARPSLRERGCGCPLDAGAPGWAPTRGAPT
jgi:hypothetical protein